MQFPAGCDTRCWSVLQALDDQMCRWLIAQDGHGNTSNFEIKQVDMSLGSNSLRQSATFLALFWPGTYKSNPVPVPGGTMTLGFQQTYGGDPVGGSGITSSTTQLTTGQ